MKRYKLLFSQKALFDSEEARSCYNLQQKGLGKRLVTDVKSVISSIKQNPYFASVSLRVSELLHAKPFLMLSIMTPSYNLAPHDSVHNL